MAPAHTNPRLHTHTNTQLTVSLPPCLPHRLSHCVSHCASLTVSLTVSLTAPPSPSLSLCPAPPPSLRLLHCLPHRLSHSVRSLTVQAALRKAGQAQYPSRAAKNDALKALQVGPR
jgi:hypothetical protein